MHFLLNSKRQSIDQNFSGVKPGQQSPTSCLIHDRSVFCLGKKRANIFYQARGEKMNKHSPLKAAVNKVGLKKIPAECMPTAFYTGIFVLGVQCGLHFSFFHCSNTHHSQVNSPETRDTRSAKGVAQRQLYAKQLSCKFQRSSAYQCADS